MSSRKHDNNQALALPPSILRPVSGRFYCSYVCLLFFLLLLSIFALIFLVFVYKRSHTFSFVDLSQTFASFLLLSLSFSLSLCLSLDNRAPLKALSFS